MGLHSLLVIDFAFFFPVAEQGHDPMIAKLYAWTRRDDLERTIGRALWLQRGAAFIERGLPLPATSGEEEEFWDRFKIKKGARLYYADDNAAATKLLDARNTETVWLYDTRHDCGYKDSPEASIKSVTSNQRVTHDDWMIYYGIIGAKLHVRYPRWRASILTEESEPAIFGGDRDIADLDEPDCTFDRIFVCRSGAWVPPWLDGEFDRFIERAPVKIRRRVGPLPRRVFDIKQARRLITKQPKMSYEEALDAMINKGASTRRPKWKKIRRLFYDRERQCFFRELYDGKIMPLGFLTYGWEGTKDWEFVEVTTSYEE